MSRNEEERIQKLEKVVNKAHVEVYHGDLNNINITKIVYAGSGATSKPGGNGYCITLTFSESYRKQIYYSQNNTNNSYVRTYNDGAWTEWVDEGVEELNVVPLLRNDWVVHGDSASNRISKDKNKVYIQLCVENGTNKIMMKLPDEYRPNSYTYFPCSSSRVNATNYISINTAGEITIPTDLIGKLLFINVSYRI